MASQDETYGGAYSGAQIDQAIGAYLSGTTGGGTNNNYSTEEQVIGTWIDGKPLYRKVISFGDVKFPGSNEDGYGNVYTKGGVAIDYPNAQEMSIDTVTKCDIATDGYSNTVYASGNLFLTVGYSKATKKFQFKQTNSSVGYYAYNLNVILEYTKTTD